MRRWMIAAFLSCSSLAAQTPTDVFEKAPPEIDSALRASVDLFFTAHIEGKFRRAEEVVAEDSKDFFYNMEKKKYLGYEIAKISYSENFTKATVVTGVEVDWRSPRIGVMRVKPPMTSLWKLEDGKWFWYVVPQKDWDTPFGKMQPGPDDPNKVMALFKGVDAVQVARQVSADKPNIRLSGYEPSTAEATIANSMPGEVRLRLEAPALQGLEVTMDKSTLKSGEQAVLVAKYEPPTKTPKPASQIRVHVEPTGQVLTFTVEFEIQPELKEKLPKELQK